MIDGLWYGQGWRWWPLRGALLTVALPFALLVALRRWGYRQGWLSSRRVGVPVVVVGNLTVGGSGKTPLVIALVEWFLGRGYRVAVISRGYGRSDESKRLRVTAGSDPLEAGDEPVLIARTTGVAVYVGSDRVAAATQAVAAGAELLISDDGLQHYRLERDLELVVVDGERRWGNGLPLPAGPLREPLSRLQQVDGVVVTTDQERGSDYQQRLEVSGLRRIDRPQPLCPLERLAGERVHAVAGIGHPERFFSLLRRHRIEVIPHPFPDHHVFDRAELQFGDPHVVVMTAKDGVKCDRLVVDSAVPVYQLELRTAIDPALEALLESRFPPNGEDHLTLA